MPQRTFEDLSRPDLMEFLMNYIERRNKEQRREPQRLITPRREPQQGGPSGGVLSNIFNVRTQEVGPPSLLMRGLQNLMNPGVDIPVPAREEGQFTQRQMQFDPTGAIGALKPILLPGKSKYIGRTVQAGRPVVDAIENDRAIKAIIPELNEALKKADNLGFESVNEARSAIRNYRDWIGRWDVEDLPDLTKLGNAYSDLVENQKAIEAAGRAIPLYTRRSNWEEISDYLLALRSQTRPARVGSPKATKMIPPGISKRTKELNLALEILNKP